MRFIKFKGLGLVFGSGLSLVGAVGGFGCSDDKFGGCEATKTCAQASAGSSGAGGSGGAKAEDASSGKGGTGGSAGMTMSASAGKPDEGVSGKGGSGGSNQKDDEDSSQGGSDDGKDEPSHASGGRVNHIDEVDMGGAGGEQAEPEPEPEGDTTPPNILLVDPPDGAKSVDKHAQIVIDFDEPMDEAATEAAFHSSDETLANAHLSWNNASRRLEIEPKDPLEYAELTDPSGDARHYAFTIGGTATDVAGNPLGVDLAFSFTTLRHVTQSLRIPEGLGREITSDGKSPSSRCGSGDDKPFEAGDWVDDVGGEALFTFDIASLPADVTEWRSARLRAVLEPTTRTPYGAETRLGLLRYLSVTTALDDARWTKPGETDLGVFASSSGNRDTSRDVLSAFTADYENRTSRGNRSQYLLRFDMDTDGDAKATYVEMSCEDVKLELEYFFP